MSKKYNVTQDTKGVEISASSHHEVVELALDREIIDWIQSKVNESKNNDYHQLINKILQDYVINNDQSQS